MRIRNRLLAKERWTHRTGARGIHNLRVWRPRKKVGHIIKATQRRHYAHTARQGASKQPLLPPRHRSIKTAARKGQHLDRGNESATASPHYTTVARPKALKTRSPLAIRFCVQTFFVHGVLQSTKGSWTQNVAFVISGHATCTTSTRE